MSLTGWPAVCFRHSLCRCLKDAAATVRSSPVRLLPRHTRGCVPHWGEEKKRCRSSYQANFAAPYLDVQLKKRHFHQPVYCVWPSVFRLPTAAGLFSSSKQELCWFPPRPRPHYQNSPNKESCCLLAFCWRINRGREYKPLSGVFCLFFFFFLMFVFFPPKLLLLPPSCSCCTSASRAGATGAGQRPSAWTTWGLCWGPSSTKAAPPRSSSRWRSLTASRSR